MFMIAIMLLIWNPNDVNFNNRYFTAWWNIKTYTICGVLITFVAQTVKCIFLNIRTTICNELWDCHPLVIHKDWIQREYEKSVAFLLVPAYDVNGVKQRLFGNNLKVRVRIPRHEYRKYLSNQQNRRDNGIKSEIVSGYIISFAKVLLERSHKRGILKCRISITPWNDLSHKFALFLRRAKALSIRISRWEPLNPKKVLSLIITWKSHCHLFKGAIL